MKTPRFHLNNLLKHNVDIPEAYEALCNGWRQRRRDGDDYEVLGRTQSGRYLHLRVEIKAEGLWIYHGRDMNDGEKRRYRRK